MRFMSEVEENLKNKEENEISGGTDARVYELGYLLVPTIKEEDVPATYGNLKELLISLNGEVITDEMPKMISLNYTMQKIVANVRNKFNTAYFGWVKFYMDGDKLLELKNKLDSNPIFIRFLLIKTVKENTIVAKRFIRSDMPYRRTVSPRKNKESGVAVEINKEEIDKEIDALIAV